MAGLLTAVATVAVNLAARAAAPVRQNIITAFLDSPYIGCLVCTHVCSRSVGSLHALRCMWWVWVRVSSSLAFQGFNLSKRVGQVFTAFLTLLSVASLLATYTICPEAAGGGVPTVKVAYTCFHIWV
jgi:hypothetical protein